MMTRAVVFEHGNVKLTILVSEDLSMWRGGVGFFEVVGIEDICWDNLEYFSNLPFKKFKEDFRQEELDSFEELGYKLKDIYKSIKKLLKDAERLLLLRGSREESLREVVKCMLSEETDEDVIQNYVDSIKMIFSGRFK